MRGGPRQVQHLPRQGSGDRAGRKGGAGRASARGPCPPPPGPLHLAPLSSALRSPSPAFSAPQPGSLELKIRGGGGGPGGGILRRNRVRMLGWTGNTQVGIFRWEPPAPPHPSLPGTWFPPLWTSVQRAWAFPFFQLFSFCVP